MVDFHDRAWSEYTNWQNEDKKSLKKINELIKDILRNRNIGIGKPEALKGNRTGWWSREINDKDRLVYRIMENGDVQISQCKGHYNDK